MSHKSSSSSPPLMIQSPHRPMLQSLPPQMVHSNLESFLSSITPIVPSMISQVGGKNVEWFMLRDLWHCYEEWSAYGAGATVMLNTGETVVQYYTPYLSAIHLYKNEKNRSSVRDPISYPFFQYDESVSPFYRAPFKDKIDDLVKNCPTLMSLKNIDLCPASWMSIAWIPIYHIPSCEKDDDLATYFLTYHTLSSHFQGSQEGNDASILAEKVHLPKTVEKVVGTKSEITGKNTIALPPFGLSTLKLQGNIWINNVDDYAKIMDFHSAADSWLKQLKVRHSDFDHYKAKNMEVGSIFIK